MKVIPMLLVCLERPQKLGKRLWGLEMRGIIKTLENTGLLRSFRILRRVLETWSELLRLWWDLKSRISTPVKSRMQTHVKKSQEKQSLSTFFPRTRFYIGLYSIMLNFMITYIDWSGRRSCKNSCPLCKRTRPPEFKSPLRLFIFHLVIIPFEKSLNPTILFQAIGKWDGRLGSWT